MQGGGVFEESERGEVGKMVDEHKKIDLIFASY